MDHSVKGGKFYYGFNLCYLKCTLSGLVIISVFREHFLFSETKKNMLKLVNALGKGLKECSQTINFNLK